jgi:hypothetical protein
VLPARLKIPDHANDPPEALSQQWPVQRHLDVPANWRALKDQRGHGSGYVGRKLS